MRQWILILLTLLLLLPGAALADEVCTVKDASAAGHITTDCAYLKVCCPLDGETRVTLTVRDAWGGLLYQRDHGSCKGTFRSGEIHLPLQGQFLFSQLDEAFYRELENCTYCGAPLRNK